MADDRLLPLRIALDKLRDALFEPDVIRGGDEVSIELSYDAGRRMEIWLRLNAIDFLHHRTLTNDAGDYRVIEIEGIRFKWPVRRISVPGAGSVPEPWPHCVAELPKFG